MNTQVTPEVEVSAPVLREAVEVNDKLILFVHNLLDPAHCEIPHFSDAAAGDKIALKVLTSTGNEKDYVHVLTASDLGRPLILTIKKAVFEKNLSQGATAFLYYIVTTVSGKTLTSPVLLVHLEA